MAWTGTRKAHRQCSIFREDSGRLLRHLWLWSLNHHASKSPLVGKYEAAQSKQTARSVYALFTRLTRESFVYDSRIARPAFLPLDLLSTRLFLAESYQSCGLGRLPLPTRATAHYPLFSSVLFFFPFSCHFSSCAFFSQLRHRRAAHSHAPKLEERDDRHSQPCCTLLPHPS